MKIRSSNDLEKFRQRSGLTLLELMVAMSLLTIIVLGLYMMFDRVQKAFRGGNTQVDVLEGGRSTMGILMPDIEQMHGAGADPTDVLNVTNVTAGTTNYTFTPAKSYINVFWDDLTSVNNPITQILPSGTRVTNHVSELFFLKNTNGGWVAVGYRLASRSDYYQAPTNGVGTLLRFEYGLRNLEDMRIPIGAPDVTNNPIHRFTTSNSQFTNDFQPVLDGVVHFQVRLLPANGLPYDTTQLLVPNTAPFGRPVPQGGTAVVLANNMMPSSVEVELGVMEPQGVEQVRGLPNLNLQTNFLAQPEQTAKVHLFRQQIFIRQGF